MPVGLIACVVLRQTVGEKSRRRCHSRAGLGTRHHDPLAAASPAGHSLSAERNRFLINFFFLPALIWEAHFRGDLRVGKSIITKKSRKQL